MPHTIADSPTPSLPVAGDCEGAPCGVTVLRPTCCDWGIRPKTIMQNNKKSVLVIVKLKFSVVRCISRGFIKNKKTILVQLFLILITQNENSRKKQYTIECSALNFVNEENQCSSSWFDTCIKWRFFHLRGIQKKKRNYTIRESTNLNMYE